VVSQVVKLMLRKRIHVEDANVLILGLTFKENCPDIRNTRVVDIYHEFLDYGANVDIYDPWVLHSEVEHEYRITPVNEPAAGKYDAIILAVAHDQFKDLGVEAIRKFGRRESIIYDIKSILPADQVDGRL